MEHHNLPTDEKTWDEFYRSRNALWSGNANPPLIAEVSDLSPGTALDAGCGEGGDALWLAQKGWQVTGLDISSTALDRAAAAAASTDPDAARRITWCHANLISWQPTTQFDLVSAHFIHLPQALREPIFATLANAVSVGGTLLIVGHHQSDVQSGIARPDVPDWYFTAEDIGETLHPAQWQVLVAESRNRTITRDGESFAIADTVLRALRRP